MGGLLSNDLLTTCLNLFTFCLRLVYVLFTTFYDLFTTWLQLVYDLFERAEAPKAPERSELQVDVGDFGLIGVGEWMGVNW